MSRIGYSSKSEPPSTSFLKHLAMSMAVIDSGKTTHSMFSMPLPAGPVPKQVVDDCQCPCTHTPPSSAIDNLEYECASTLVAHFPPETPCFFVVLPDVDSTKGG